MGFQIFLVMVLFIVGTKGEIDALDRCLTKLDFADEFTYDEKDTVEDDLNAFCVNISSFFKCINDALLEDTGFDLKELAKFLEGTEIGAVVGIAVNMEGLVVELCTEGSQYREDFLENSECFLAIDDDVLDQCEERANDAYAAFKEMQTGTSRMDEPCILSAYRLGCLGAEVKEQCGEGGFNVYKESIKKIGIFKSGVCSTDIMRTIKTTFMDSLVMSDSRKSIYRVILELKKKRK